MKHEGKKAAITIKGKEIKSMGDYFEAGGLVESPTSEELRGFIKKHSMGKVEFTGKFEGDREIPTYVVPVMICE